MSATYELGRSKAGYPFIKCLICGFVSFNKHDVAQRYCVMCDKFHEDKP